MWRGLIGLLFVVAAIGCFVGARYAPEATNMYILIDLGCAALAGAVATQVPGAAAFFYSYIAVLVVTLGVNGFFVLAASLAIASALSYSAYHYLVSGSMSRLPEPDRSGLRGHWSWKAGRSESYISERGTGVAQDYRQKGAADRAATRTARHALMQLSQFFRK
jgi:hypothetical protein